MVFIILFFLAWLPIRLLFPTKVIGKKNLLKKQGYVFTCNHYSNIDPIVLNIFLNKKIRFIAKKELFKNKFFAWVLRGLGAFPVDREKMDISTFKFALNTLKENKILGIFPEGTRNKSEDESLKEVKSGAVVFAGKAGVPIIPAMFYKKSKVFRRNHLIIGEPFYIEAENPKKMTQEEIEQNTLRLSAEMNFLVQEFENGRNKNKKDKDTVKDDDVKKQKETKEERIDNATVRIFDEVLLEGEKIKKSFKPTSSRVYLLNFLKPLFVYIIFVLLFVYMYVNSDVLLSRPDSLVYLYSITGLFIILEIITLLITKKSLKNVYFVVTDKRVISSSGIFNYEFNSLEFNRIKDINISWGVFDKIFGKKYGHISLLPDDKSLSVIHFYSIYKPVDCYIYIQELLEKTND